MNRFHLNWNTGNPQRCSKLDCPEPFHSDDPLACLARYEAAMERRTGTLPQPWTRKNSPPRRLS